MELPSVVSVEWLDAHYNTDEVDASDITHRAWSYTTVGFLVKTDDVGVTLSSDVGEDGRLRGRNFIPRGMVVKETVYVAKKKGRERTQSPPLVAGAANHRSSSEQS